MPRLGILASCTVVCSLVTLSGLSSSARGQYAAEDQTVQQAAAVLNEAMATAGNRIPHAMLENAHGVAIIPNVVKGSFIVGARHGRGLLFVREPDGVWHAPVFISLTGGNIGWQVGVQSSDLLLVFKTARSVQGILSGTLTLGADAAAAAGPIGRQGAIATDGQLKAEIYTYSRSRGLFAGVSIDGSVIQMDPIATGSYYRSPAPGQNVVVPLAAEQLTRLVAAYATNQPIAVAPESLAADLNTPAEFRDDFVQQYGATEADLLRGQLAQISPRLFQLLDEPWTVYLSLPPALLRGENPDPASLQSTVQRYSNVATDPQYRELAARPEFQSVFGLLQHYQQSLNQSPASLQLPPPPRQ